ncbi:MAG TPA: DUF2085 domain-containing protein [Candidatus Altiarchaeales archaeon]|nr:DUF2085 domain-containing protein [Candidatus Altiarchaeales archaeon]
MNKYFGGYLVLSAVFLLIFLLVIAPPFLDKYGRENLLGLDYLVFSGYCHQLDYRSLHLWGVKLAVCARCTGVYLGFLIGTLAYPFFRKLDSGEKPPVWLIAVAVFPMVLDGGTQLIGLRESNNMLRLFTGLLFGACIAPYLVFTMSRLVEEVAVKFRRSD